MSQIQTSCPRCGTNFTVGKKEIAAANGHVRCGVCMDIFQIKASEKDRISTPQTNAVTPPKKTKDKQDLKKYSSILSKSIHGPVRAPSDDDNEGPVELITIEDEISDAFDSLDSPDEADRLNFAKKIPAPVKVNQYIKKDAVATQAVDKQDREEEIDRISSAIENTELKEDEVVYQSSQNDVDDAFGSILDDDLFGHDDDAVAHIPVVNQTVSSYPHQKNRRQFPLLWLAASLVFSITLAAQLLIKNFDDLSVDERYRGFYAFFCSRNVCELPIQKDVGSVRANHLIVRPHAKYSNALIVDTIINNLAPFEQNFPRLLLSFSDTQGTVVASRVFLPKEYLNGELKQLNLMPIKSPLHISLEIASPGERASSYKIDFIEDS